VREKANSRGSTIMVKTILKNPKKMLGGEASFIGKPNMEVLGKKIILS
jgi:hypothetical protein